MSYTLVYFLITGISVLIDGSKVFLLGPLLPSVHFSRCCSEVSTHTPTNITSSCLLVRLSHAFLALRAWCECSKEIQKSYRVCEQGHIPETLRVEFLLSASRYSGSDGRRTLFSPHWRDDDLDCSQCRLLLLLYDLKDRVLVLVRSLPFLSNDAA